MAVGKKGKVLVSLRKGPEQTKVLEEFVGDYLKAGWKKVVVKKGKRDPKTDLLLEGEVDTVTLEGIDEPDVAALKATIAKLELEITGLKAKLKG